MYKVFMTHALISTQIGHLDRAAVMSNAGITDARRLASRHSDWRLVRKKS